MAATGAGLASTLLRVLTGNLRPRHAPAADAVNPAPSPITETTR